MSHTALHGTACIGCRRRGRKCDRTLPTCMSCEQRGMICEGYVTKWPGVAARGKLAGKTIPVVDSSVAIPKPSSASARARQRQTPLLRDQKHIPADAANLPAKHGSLDDIPSPRNNLSSISDDEVSELVQHYIGDLSSIFFLGNGPSNNPMFHYVLPLVDSVPPIRFALAGSASCHIAARNSDEALERKSLRLRVHATRLLREMLQDPSTTSDQSILASILMLAQLDMCSGDCTEFETHLKAAAAVIRHPRYDSAANKYYFEQRLAWLDMMSSTTSTRLPNLTVEEFKTILGRLTSNGGTGEWSYDVFLCPVDLFEIITDITMLFKKQQKAADISQMELQQIEHLGSRLREWQCPREFSGSRKHMVEAWRLGIMAYLRQLFHFTDQAGAAALLGAILDHAKLIPPATSWSFALTWPIFQASVTLGDGAQEEKTWIREHLRHALQAVGCRHFPNALETLEMAWEHPNQLNPIFTKFHDRTIILV